MKKGPWSISGRLNNQVKGLNPSVKEAICLRDDGPPGVCQEETIRVRSN